MTKTVAITGATGTLGRAVAQRFTIYGWRKALAGHVRRFAEIEDGIGNTMLAPSWPLDIANEQDLSEWLNGQGDIDALVTCAGVSLVKPSLEMTADEWYKVIDVNLAGTFLSIREAVKRGATRIVTIGSIHGSTPTSYPERAAYTASKAGVVGLTQALAVELAPKGIAINCVAPGHLPVLMDGTGAGQALLDAAQAKTPTGKLATPQEVAEVIYWLCNDAPLSLTGQVLTVSGGYELNTWPMEQE